ncbi:hypothetical protein EIP86_011173 [Pleurotus ostreatoroseus]|nr:hypothetical protein EIP86_011173 [Pleurotus ostreatoroseus]
MSDSRTVAEADAIYQDLLTATVVASGRQILRVKIMHNGLQPNPGLDATDPCILVTQVRKRLLEIERCAEKSPGEIQEMNELQRQYCALAPITSCPPEILSDIFNVHVASHWDDYDFYISSSPPNGWIHILHVCRTWRDVVFATPRLWTRIAATSPEFVQLAVSYSGSLPLYFRSTPRNPITRELELYVRRPVKLSTPPGLLASSSAIWPLLPRLRHLEIYLDSTILEEIHAHSQNMQAVVAVELEELDIKCSLTNSEPSNVDIPALPITHFPKLATLRLCCTHDSGSILRPLLRVTLTTLTLTATSPTMVPRSLAEALQSVPLLQSLHLADFLEYRQLDSLLPSQKTELKHLRTLRLEESRDTGVASVELIKRLTFPAYTEVLLCVLYRKGTRAYEYTLDLDTLCSGLAAPESVSASFARPRSMVIGLPTGMRQEPPASAFYLWADERPRNFPHVGVQDAARFGLVFRSPRGVDIDFSSLITRLDTTKIISLGVRVSLRQEAWMHIFKHLKKVERLFIEDLSTAYGFLAAFGESLSPDAHRDTETKIEEHQPGPHHFPFSNLKELELPLMRSWFPPVIASLKRRRDHGLCLEQLMIRYNPACPEPDELALIRDAQVVRRVEILYQPG